MDERKIGLAKYRLEKAKSELKASAALIDAGLLPQSLSRSYYSIFHAVRALLAFEGVDSKKHAGVISHFSNLFVRTDLLDRDMVQILTNAFEVRQNSDYKDFYVVVKDDVIKQHENAQTFLQKIEAFITDHYEIHLTPGDTEKS